MVWSSWFNPWSVSLSDRYGYSYGYGYDYGHDYGYDYGYGYGYVYGSIENYYGFSFLYVLLCFWLFIVGYFD